MSKEHFNTKEYSSVMEIRENICNLPETAIGSILVRSRKFLRSDIKIFLNKKHFPQVLQTLNLFRLRSLQKVQKMQRHCVLHAQII